MQTDLSFSHRGPSEGHHFPEAFSLLVNIWSSQRRATEATMRGTANESAVLKALPRYTWIEDVFCIRMILNGVLKDPSLECLLARWDRYPCVSALATGRVRLGN